MRIAGALSIAWLAATLAADACDRDRGVALGPVATVDGAESAVASNGASAALTLAATDGATALAWLAQDDSGVSLRVRRIDDTAAPVARVPLAVDGGARVLLAHRGGAQRGERQVVGVTGGGTERASSLLVTTSRDDGASWSPPVVHALGARGPAALGADGAASLLAASIDTTGATPRIVVARPKDGGAEWQVIASQFVHRRYPPARRPTTGFSPQLGVAGDGAGTIVVVWTDVVSEALESVASHDGGRTWSAARRIDEAMAPPLTIRVAFAGRRPVVVWSGGGMLLADSSPDGGESWSPDTILSYGDTGATLAFDLLGGPDVAHVAFQARPEQGLRAVYDVAINEDGLWSAEHDGMRPVGASGSRPAPPRLARGPDGSTLYLVFGADDRVLLARSRDEGAMFEPPVTIATSAAGESVHDPQVAAADGRAYVAWAASPAPVAPGAVPPVALAGRAVTFAR